MTEELMREENPLAFLSGGGAMGDLIRNRDWRQSELGPAETWPLALKSSISHVLNSATAMHISWGENLLQFYNDAYTPVLTDGKHPAALGLSVKESFPEIWDFVGPLFDRVRHHGEAIAMENAALMMYRDGVLTESFFSFSYSPLRSLSGEICGVASVCWETTEEVFLKRRERALHLLTEQLAAATTLEEVRHAVCGLVPGNRGDLPFLLWYERDEGHTHVRLMESCGISSEAPLVSGLGAHDGRSALGKALDFNVPGACLLSLPEPATDWLTDPPVAIEVECVAIEPLCYVNYLTPDAYLVFGVGQNRPADDRSNNFHQGICRAVERALRRISAAELERREGVRQFDAVMRLTLDAARIGYWDLDLITHVAKRSLLHDQIFGYDEPVADWSYEGFLDHVCRQDRERVDRIFKAGVDAKAEWDLECRIIRRDGALRWIWVHGDVLANADGDPVRTLGIILDITDRKHIEEAMRESEQCFASAFEHAPIGKALIAPDGRYLKVNRVLCEFLGYSSAELLGTTFQALTHSDDIAPDLATMQRLLSGEISTCEIEKRYIHGSGEVLSALLSVSLVRDDEGDPRYFVSQVQDITEQKLAQESLRKNEARLRTILEAEPECVQVLTTDGRVLSMNAAGLRMVEAQTFAQIAGRPMRDLIHPEDWKSFLDLHRRVVAGETGQLQFRVVGIQGGLRWMDTHSTPLRDNDGAVEAVLSVTRDVSDRHEVEQRLGELRGLTQQILDSVGEGIQGVDRDGRISFSNPAAEIMLGWREEEMVGKIAHPLYHHHQPDGRPYDKVDCPIYKTLEDGTPRRVDDEVFFHRDGQAFPVEYVVTPVRDSEGLESGVVVCFRDISTRLAEAAARELNEERLRLVTKLTVNAIWDWDLATDGVTWTGGLESLFGHPDADFEFWISCVHPDDRERVRAFLNTCARNGPDNWEVEFKFGRRCGGHALVLARGVVVRDDDRLAVRMVGGMSDITGIRELEDQLRQSQRLESVGQLTGGMAHDFNNLLTIIMGNAELLTEELESAPKLRGLAEMVAQAAQRGAELTSSLLAFARKQALEPGPVDANQMLGDMHGLLRRTLGEDIEIDLVPDACLWTAMADQPQLESAVLNLCLNARDAMPTGGRLLIETANVHLDNTYAAQYPGLNPGEYVMVAVADTGTGIPADLLARVCEPFFTTKETGKGTGLGLSMVYGFAKQSHGHLALSSGPGPGTTVRIYLPRIVRTRGVAQVSQQPGQEDTGHGQCVLLVEDDSPVRAIAKRQLEMLGYRVVEAQDGPGALRSLAEHPDVDLLFTDVVMSGGMSGRQLVDAVHALRPNLPVLYTSGYTEDAIVHHGRLDPGVLLLGKPYLRAELAAKLHQAFSRETRS